MTTISVSIASAPGVLRFSIVLAAKWFIFGTHLAITTNHNAASTGFRRSEASGTHRAYPFIVHIQSDIISDLAARIVVPLRRKTGFKKEELQRLTPTIEYDDKEELLLVPQVASIPARVLKYPIGSLSHLRDEIVAALDFAITDI